MSSEMRQVAGLRGDLREQEPMARHTSWRVGGPAARWYAPADIDDLANFLAALHMDEPLWWVGLGSNLLVRDGGLPGTVIATSGVLDGLELAQTDLVYAEAGVSCAKLARFAAREGLVGAEFLAGIPGTLGGALAMNAGCFGGDTWPLIERVETIDHHGVRRVRNASDYCYGYRHVQGPIGEWFIAAWMRLQPGDGDAAVSRVRELLDQRAASQPIGTANAGSVFRNPPTDYAARLIEAAGLKGRCVGGACVSNKHANFIINQDGANAAEIEALIHEVQAEVEVRFGVRLEPEVKILGDEGPEA